MKTLSEKEIKTINGGAAENQSVSSGISVTSSSDSLLSLTFTRTMGDYQSTDTLSVGNDIDLNIWAKAKH